MTFKSGRMIIIHVVNIIYMTISDLTAILIPEGSIFIEKEVGIPCPKTDILTILLLIILSPIYFKILK